MITLQCLCVIELDLRGYCIEAAKILSHLTAIPLIIKISLHISTVLGIISKLGLFKNIGGCSWYIWKYIILYHEFHYIQILIFMKGD